MPFRKLIARADRTADRGPAQERGYNPMPEGWRPRSPGPVIPASLPPQTRPSNQGVSDTPADAGRPTRPPPSDSGD